MDRAVVEDQHHRPAFTARPRAVGPVEPGQQVDEVAGALGRAGGDDQLAGGVIERTEERALLRLPRGLDPQIGPAPGPAVGQVGVGQRLGFVPEQEADIAGHGLLLQEPEPPPGAIDRRGVLPSPEAVPRPAPALAPLRGTTLRW